MKRVIFSEETHDKQIEKSISGLIKCSILCNNRANQSDPRLAWIIFYKIPHMYRYIIKQ